MSQKRKIWIGILAYACVLGSQLSLHAQPCPPPNPILGTSLVCPGSQQVYAVTTDNRPTSVYQWELFGGGTFVGATNGVSVTINWQNTNGGPFLLRCTERIGMCFMQNELTITVADDLARRPFNCFGELSIPLDENCEKLILPEHLLTSGAPDCANSFVVDLFLDDGLPIPNPVTIQYLGLVINAKVTHVRSGRSCTSRIILKDGTAPRLTCENDTTICNDPHAWNPFHSSFKRPVATDNCQYQIQVEPQGYEWIQLFNDPVFDAYLVRSWSAVDKYNNRSTCQDTIFLRKILFDMVVCPPDTVIQCHDKKFKPNDPLTTGVPTFDGFPLWSDRSYCDFSIKYEDFYSYKCFGTYTIHRYWYYSQITPFAIREDTCHQVIQVVDTVGPVASFDSTLVKNKIHLDVIGLPQNRPYKTIYYPTLDYTCVAHGYFPKAKIYDNCSPADSIIVDVIWENGHLNWRNGSPEADHVRFENLTKGKHIVTLKLRDACHNTSYDTLIVVAEDSRPPYIVVDKHPVVTLGAFSDITWIDVSVFDEGTWDNCYLEILAGRRVDWEDACGYSPDTSVANELRDHYRNYQLWLEEDGFRCYEYLPFGFSDKIPFCCEDACKEEKVTIELWALDASCNLAKVWVDVLVEDKSAPIVQKYLPDLEISCWAYNKFYKEEVDKGNFSVFGKYEAYEQSLYNGNFEKTIIKDRICTLDKEQVDYYELEYDTIFHGLVLENCSLLVFEKQKTHFERCGIGWIERHFSFRGECQTTYGDSTWVVQKIYIVNDCPLLENEIIWPTKDTIVYQCSYSNIQTDAPRLKHEDDCREIGIHYKDQIVSDLYNAESTCLKVIRTWAIIDWCRQTEPYHHEWIGNQNYHYYEFEQIIYIENSIAPQFSNCELDTICIGHNCYGVLNKTVSVSDDCTPVGRINVSWILYEESEYGYLPLDQGNGTTALVEGLNTGNYKLVMIAVDECGNESVCSDLFTVSDCKKPTPVCLSNTTLKLIPIDRDLNGLIDTAVGEIWAQELNVSSYDNCFQDIDFRVRVRGTGSINSNGVLVPPDPNAKSIRFGCADVGVMEIEFWVVDQSGNADFCVVQVDVIPPVEGCHGGISDVKGVVSSMSGAALEGITLHLKDSLGNVWTSLTQKNGYYDFNPYKLNKQTHTLWAEATGDVIDGVTTRDVIRIAKHLLSKEPMRDKYEILAADANQDGDLSVLDIITLRKLILGKIFELPGSSWKFFNRNDSELSLISSQHNYRQLTDFVGIKIGDVNGDVSNYYSSGRSRGQDLILSYQDQKFESGELVELMIRGPENMPLDGLQFSMMWDMNVLELLDYRTTGFGSEEAIYFTGTALNFMEIYENSRSMEAQGILHLRFRALEEGSVSESMALASDRMKPEAYLDEWTYPLKLIPEKSHINDQFLGNYPNPFVHQTQLEFHTTSEGTAELFVFDIGGRNVHRRSLFVVKGTNVLTINRQDLPGQGLYPFELRTEKTIWTGRLTLLN